jgi:hypothetical protein
MCVRQQELVLQVLTLMESASMPAVWLPMPAGVAPGQM